MVWRENSLEIHVSGANLEEYLNGLVALQKFRSSAIPENLRHACLMTMKKRKEPLTIGNVIDQLDRGFYKVLAKAEHDIKLAREQGAAMAAD